MISSSSSMLYRFLLLYGLLYAGFGVQSPYLPILLDNRHLRPETIALALTAGTAMRLIAAQAVARLADRLDAPKVFLALCTTAAALIGLGYLPAQKRLVADCGRRFALGGTGAAPATQRHARPRCRGSRWVRRCGHPLRLAARVRVGRLCSGLGTVRPSHRTFWDRRNRLAKRRAACCRGTHSSWRTTTIGDRPRAGPAEPGSRSRTVVTVAALSEYGFARNVNSWESCDARLLCDDPLEQGRDQPRHVWHLVVAFGRRRGRRLPLDRPSFARPHRPGGRGDALRRRRCRAMGSDGRDRVASSSGGDRALARPNVRALASDVHAAVGTMRSKAPRGDSTDDLRYRRHRYSDCSAPPGTCSNRSAEASRLLTLACGPIFERFGAHGFWAMAALCAAALPLTLTLRQPMAGSW